eukprot:365266-Chlamydomonas_euryale.AAC.5
MRMGAGDSCAWELVTHAHGSWSLMRMGAGDSCAWELVTHVHGSWSLMRMGAGFRSARASMGTTYFRAALTAASRWCLTRGLEQQSVERRSSPGSWSLMDLANGATFKSACTRKWSGCNIGPR